jgi:hypothetical protein
MSTEYLSYIFPVLVVTLVLSQVFFLYLIAKALQDRKNEIDKEEKIIQDTKVHAAEILKKAIQDANAMVAQAQHDSSDIVAHQQQSGAELARVFEKHLKDVEATLKTQFDANSQTANSAYKEFIKIVEDSISQQIEKNNQMIQEKSSQMIANTQGLMDKFVKNVEGKVTQQIDAELRNVREEINQYKVHRMQVIDERIIEILEDIIQVALEKKLSLAEQSELVYRALDEAKHENAFAK